MASGFHPETCWFCTHSAPAGGGLLHCGELNKRVSGPEAADCVPFIDTRDLNPITVDERGFMRVGRA